MSLLVILCIFVWSSHTSCSQNQRIATVKQTVHRSMSHYDSLVHGLTKFTDISADYLSNLKMATRLGPLSQYVYDYNVTTLSEVLTMHSTSSSPKFVKAGNDVEASCNILGQIVAVGQTKQIGTCGPICTCLSAAGEVECQVPCSVTPTCGDAQVLSPDENDACCLICVDKVCEISSTESYVVGEVWFPDGCAVKCECLAEDQWTCGDRCPVVPSCTPPEVEVPEHDPNDACCTTCALPAGCYKFVPATSTEEFIAVGFSLTLGCTEICECHLADVDDADDAPTTGDDDDIDDEIPTVLTCIPRCERTDECASDEIRIQDTADSCCFDCVPNDACQVAHGVFVQRGDSIQLDNGCTSCSCSVAGDLSCVVEECDTLQCTVDEHPVTDPNNPCCSVCAEVPVCEVNGVRVQVGEELLLEGDCAERCKCTTDLVLQCFSRCVDQLSCAPGFAHEPSVEDPCCLTCVGNPDAVDCPVQTVEGNCRLDDGCTWTGDDCVYTVLLPHDPTATFCTVFIDGVQTAVTTGHVWYPQGCELRCECYEGDVTLCEPRCPEAVCTDTQRVVPSPLDSCCELCVVVPSCERDGTHVFAGQEAVFGCETCACVSNNNFECSPRCPDINCGPTEIAGPSEAPLDDQCECDECFDALTSCRIGEIVIPIGTSRFLPNCGQDCRCFSVVGRTEGQLQCFARCLVATVHDIVCPVHQFVSVDFRDEECCRLCADKQPCQVEGVLFEPSDGEVDVGCSRVCLCVEDSTGKRVPQCKDRCPGLECGIGFEKRLPRQGEPQDPCCYHCYRLPGCVVDGHLIEFGSTAPRTMCEDTCVCRPPTNEQFGGSLTCTPVCPPRTCKPNTPLLPVPGNPCCYTCETHGCKIEGENGFSTTIGVREVVALPACGPVCECVLSSDHTVGLTVCKDRCPDPLCNTNWFEVVPDDNNPCCEVCRVKIDAHCIVQPTGEQVFVGDTLLLDNCGSKCLCEPPITTQSAPTLRCGPRCSDTTLDCGFDVIIPDTDDPACCKMCSPPLTLDECVVSTTGERIPVGEIYFQPNCGKKCICSRHPDTLRPHLGCADRCSVPVCNLDVERIEDDPTDLCCKICKPINPNTGDDDDGNGDDDDDIDDGGDNDDAACLTESGQRLSIQQSILLPHCGDLCTCLFDQNNDPDLFCLPRCKKYPTTCSNGELLIPDPTDPICCNVCTDQPQEETCLTDSGKRLIIQQSILLPHCGDLCTCLFDQNNNPDLFCLPRCEEYPTTCSNGELLIPDPTDPACCNICTDQPQQCKVLAADKKTIVHIPVGVTQKLPDCGLKCTCSAVDGLWCGARCVAVSCNDGSERIKRLDDPCCHICAPRCDTTKLPPVIKCPPHHTVVLDGSLQQHLLLDDILLPVIDNILVADYCDQNPNAYLQLRQRLAGSMNDVKLNSGDVTVDCSHVDQSDRSLFIRVKAVNRKRRRTSCDIPLHVTDPDSLCCAALYNTSLRCFPTRSTTVNLLRQPETGVVSTMLQFSQLLPTAFKTDLFACDSPPSPSQWVNLISMKRSDTICSNMLTCKDFNTTTTVDVVYRNVNDKRRTCSPSVHITDSNNECVKQEDLCMGQRDAPNNNLTVICKKRLTLQIGSKGTTRIFPNRVLSKKEDPNFTKACLADELTFVVTPRSVFDCADINKQFTVCATWIDSGGNIADCSLTLVVKDKKGICL